VNTCSMDFGRLAYRSDGQRPHLAGKRSVSFGELQRRS
jgi:hypothetical protein